ncbi:histidine kinase [Lacinutrix chionoecetis]
MPKKTTYKAAKAFLKFVIVLQGIFFFIFAHAQDYDVSMIKVNNNNFSVYLQKKLYLDDDGFLWYSTRNGIVKEMGNGKNFFFEYAFDKNKYDQVLNGFSILKSSKNKLWTATEKGINILDLKTTTSRWIETNYPNTENRVLFTDIAEDSLGNIWLATDKEYIFCYTTYNQLIPYKLEDSDFSVLDTSILQKSRAKIKRVFNDNSILIHQHNKWILFKNGQGRVIHKDKIKAQTFASIIVPNGSVFTTNTSGTYKYKNTFFNYKYVDEIDSHIVENPFPNIQFIPNQFSNNFNNAINIIATNEKDFLLLKIKSTDSSFELVEKDVINFKHNITNVTYDVNGYFWLHTEDGLHKIRYNDVGFKKHLNDKNISCRGITETKNGDFYVFTYQGIFKKSHNDESFAEVTNIKNKKIYQQVKNLSYNFYNQDDKTFWFYGYHNSLIAFNPINGTFTTHKIPNVSINIIDAKLVTNNSLLLATNKGLYSFNFDTKLFKNESVLSSNIDLTNETIHCVTLTQDKKTLWISNSGKHNLIKQNIDTKAIKTYNTSSKDLPLIDNIIKVIYEDTKNSIWLGTRNGLQNFNPKTLEYKNYNAINGFTNANIAGVLEDKDNFWISTFNGLIKLNKATQNVQTYYNTDGLTHNEFNITSACKASNGLLYFGGLNGITSFNPEEISNKNKVYKIKLTDYQIYDKEKQKNVNVITLLDNPENVCSFNIPYLQNYLTLSFSINDIFNAENNVYQYRINELSEEWIDLGNFSKIELRGVNPGDYTLDVRGFSSNGNQTNMLRYDIKINQIFYKKGWFIALNIIVVFMFIILRNKNRREYLKKTYEQKNKIQQLEAKALRAQMNPHFIFNTLNGMQSVMILKGEREANKYFSAFSKLLRITLDMSNAEYIILKKEISYLKSYLELENLRLNNRIKINFTVDPDLDIDNYCIPCMLFQPVIENAILHGLTPKKENLCLDIEFKLEGTYLIGIVIDSGIGRKNSQKEKVEKASTHKSWSTHIMNERIAISNATMHEKITWKITDLEDSKNNALGTKVVLRIPLKEHLDSK